VTSPRHRRCPEMPMRGRSWSRRIVAPCADCAQPTMCT
jgi:hypothetical protein